MMGVIVCVYTPIDRADSPTSFPPSFPFPTVRPHHTQVAEAERIAAELLAEESKGGKKKGGGADASASGSGAGGGGGGGGKKKKAPKA